MCTMHVCVCVWCMCGGHISVMEAHVCMCYACVCACVCDVCDVCVCVMCVCYFSHGGSCQCKQREGPLQAQKTEHKPSAIYACG